MAFIRKRGKKFSVIYRIKDDNGKEHQTSETFSTQKDAEKRKKEIEYKMAIGEFEVPKCTILEELIEERTGINTMTAENPMTCVAVGTGKYVEFLAGRRDD